MQRLGFCAADATGPPASRCRHTFGCVMASKRQGNELWWNWSAMQHVCLTAPLAKCNTFAERASISRRQSRRLLFRRHCPSAYITLTKQQRRGERERERETACSPFYLLAGEMSKALSAVKRFSLSLFVCCRGSAALCDFFARRRWDGSCTRRRRLHGVCECLWDVAHAYYNKYCVQRTVRVWYFSRRVRGRPSPHLFSSFVPWWRFLTLCKGASKHFLLHSLQPLTQIFGEYLESLFFYLCSRFFSLNGFFNYTLWRYKKICFMSTLILEALLLHLTETYFFCQSRFPAQKIGIIYNKMFVLLFRTAP